MKTSVPGHSPLLTGHSLHSKGTPVFVFLLILSLVAVASIVGTVVSVSTDGYSRVPERKFVRSF